MSAIKWTFQHQFPTNSNFVNRIVSAEFKKSKSGNPMIEWVAEVVTPAEADAGGILVNIAGVKTTQWNPTQVFEEDGTLDVDKTKNAQDRVTKLYSDIFGEDSDEVKSLNMENPDTKVLIGKMILTSMNGKPEARRANPTTEEIAKSKGGRAQGAIMKHPVTGKELISYKPTITEVFGAAPSGY